MKIIALFFCFMCISAKGQTWRKVVVSKDVTLSMPGNVEERRGGDNHFFLSKNNNCAYMVGVAYNAIPEYGMYLNLSKFDRARAIDSFLMNIVAGKFNNIDRSTALIKKAEIEGCQALVLEYTSNKSVYAADRFSSIFFVKNTLYTIECWFINSEEGCMEDKDFFLKSIRVIH